MNQPNVILIVMDTLRADVVYRELRNLPNFSYIAGDGVVYKNAIAPSPWTVPSHASMFLGKYASEHGVHKYPDSTDSARLMAEKLGDYACNDAALPSVLRRRGYQTISLHSNLLLSRGTGFENGFEICESIGPMFIIQEASREYHRLTDGKSGILGFASSGVRSGLKDLLEMSSTYARAKRRLWRAGFPTNKGAPEIMTRFKSMKLETPFFAFINLLEAHEPYGVRKALPPRFQDLSWGSELLDLTERRAFSESYLKRTVDAYKSEVIVLDSFLGELINYLKEIRQYDETLIVLTSDHGQSLGEAHFVGHGYFLHDQLTDVPLIVKYPKSFQTARNGGFRTLVDMKRFVEGWSDCHGSDFPAQEAAFSEAYGFAREDFSHILGEDYDLRENVLRKSIWKKGAKLTIDGTNGRIEEFKKNGHSLRAEESVELVREMISDTEIFVGLESFRLPDDI